MRSRAGSWSLAIVLVLSVLMIAGSSGPGSLALAQSDGTPVVEDPVTEQQLPVEVPTETSAPDLPIEIPVSPTDTPVPPTEGPSSLTETPLPTEPARNESIVQAASESAISLNTSECTIYPDYWLVHLSLDQSAFPSSLTFAFASGVLVTASFSGNSWVEGSGYRGSYVSYDNLGTSDQLVSVSGEMDSGLNSVAYLKFGPSCTPAEPTATPIPTVTPTPTWSGTMTTLFSTFIDCEPNSSMWQFRLRTLGELPGDASWPSTVELTFASGATSTAVQITQTIGENAAQFEFRSTDNLTDALVSGTLSLPAGVTGVLELMYAPDCSPGIPSSPTNVPSETPTASSTPTDTATSTATRTFIPTSTATSTATDVPTETATDTPAATSTPTETASNTATASSSTTAKATPTDTATNEPTHTSTPTTTDTATTTSTPTNEPTHTSTSTSTATASATPTVTAIATRSGSTTIHRAMFDECNPNPEIWYFRLTVQGTLPGGASWPESIALSFASGATGVASGFDQVVGGNVAQLWFSSNSHLGEALVSATVELPSELTGLLELLYAPNCLQGVPVTATSMPTETMTASATATETASPTITATAKATETATPSSTATDTPTETATASRTSTPLHTETATEIPTETATSSATETITPSETPTATPSSTSTPGATATPTETPSSTATPTEPPSSTSTVSSTPTSTATATATSTSTSTSTATVTSTRTLTNTATATVTESVTSTSTPTASITATVPMVQTTANVHCRIGASTSTTSLGVVSRGTFLPMRGVVSGGWTPVICFGQNGWVSSSYLATSSAATATAPALSMMTTTTRVNCRTGRSTGSAIIGVLPARTTLALRGVVQGGWYPVICFGQNGWISASYLAPGPIATTTPPSGPQAVTTTRVNCRSAPTTSGSNVITVLDSGVTVPVRGAAANGWTPVVCDGQNGWISSRYVRIS